MRGPSVIRRTVVATHHWFSSVREMQGRVGLLMRSIAASSDRAVAIVVIFMMRIPSGPFNGRSWKMRNALGASVDFRYWLGVDCCPTEHLRGRAVGDYCR